ncbi:MAG: NAD(P)-dependent oxidoreductase [Nanoarchaeota archaeon]|nr:NAD(P)-dependent oxidoreductase [Nanoarchaeota archaeon]
MHQNTYNAYAVTGAAGFLGSQMVSYLLNEGKEVIATDIKKPEWLETYQHRYSDALKFMKADLTDQESLEKALRGAKFLFHFGALFNHSADPHLLTKINIDGTSNVLAAAVRCDLERIIHIGSMSVYGHEQIAVAGEKYAITERKIPAPADPYATSKQASREIAAAYNNMNKMEVAIVDPAGIFGPGSFYGNAELIAMLLKGAMLLPDGGKHKASMIHSTDVIRMCDYVMHLPTAKLSSEKDAQEISYLAADTTPATGKELLEMIWNEIPEEFQKQTLKAITQKIPLQKWFVKPVAKLSKQYQMMYGFGDHSASPEKIMNLGFKHQFPFTQQTVQDVMNWHKQKGFIAKLKNK